MSVPINSPKIRGLIAEKYKTLTAFAERIGSSVTTVSKLLIRGNCKMVMLNRMSYALGVPILDLVGQEVLDNPPRRARVAMGYNLSDLEEKSGVSQNVIYDVEAGRNIYAAYAIFISKALDTTVEAYLGYD